MQRNRLLGNRLLGNRLANPFMLRLHYAAIERSS